MNDITLEFKGRGIPIGFATARPYVRGEPLPDSGDSVTFLNQSFVVEERTFQYTGTMLTRIVIVIEKPAE